MKKSSIIKLSLVGLLLSGCSINDLMFWKKNSTEATEEQPSGNYTFKPYITGGSLDEKTAILNVINSKPICNQSGNDVIEILPDIEPELFEDNGDDILITTRQIASNGKFVDITWDVDSTQQYFSKVSDVDSVHKLIEINYQHYGAADGKIEWKISKLQCGGAHVENPSDMQYSAVLKNEEFYHDDIKIREINRCTNQEKIVDAGGTQHKFASTYNIVDYEYNANKTYKPTFKSNQPDEVKEKRFLYYNVYGKIIYTAPDGNWGLIADGDQVLEFYIGAGKALTVENWPNIAKEYVVMSGNMGEYCGNIQLGFMTKIKEIPNKSSITEPVMTFPALSESDIASWEVDGYTCQKQAIDGFSGSLHSVTGTLVAGSLKDKSGAAVTNIDTMANNRFTFKLKVGSKEITVAYDYHTDREGAVGLFAALKSALKKGGQMTIKGSMRYAGNDDLLFITEGNDGVWNIVPFLPAHVIA